MSAAVGIDCRREFEMLRVKMTGMTCNHRIQTATDAIHSAVPSARIDTRPEDGEVAGASYPEHVIAAIVDEGYDVQWLAA
jgi:hypothetical protein